MLTLIPGNHTFISWQLDAVLFLDDFKNLYKIFNSYISKVTLNSVSNVIFKKIRLQKFQEHISTKSL